MVCGCGATDRAVVLHTRDRRFESRPSIFLGNVVIELIVSRRRNETICQAYLGTFAEADINKITSQNNST